MLQAMLVMFGIGGVLGLALSIASVVFKVEVDEREEKLTAMLPGYNCGACGFPGCSGLAASIVSGETTQLACKIVKPDQRQVIIDYLENTPGKDGSTIKLK